MDQIFISGLKLEAIIGIYPEERLAPQPMVLDIELMMDTRRAGASDDVADTIDYAELAKELQEWVAKQAFQLIETLANQLAERILQTFLKAQSVCLRVQKFPLGLPIDSAGVVIVRSRGSQ